MPILLSPARPEFADWNIVCLCAAWCRTCDGYQPELAQLAAREPQLRFYWLDIEDDADWVDALDVETFPTLLVLANGVPMFFGPLPPQIGVFERTLQTLRAPGAPPATLESEVNDALRDIDQRLRLSTG